MSTLQQQLAQAIAERQALVGNIDVMRSTAMSELDRVQGLWTTGPYGRYPVNAPGEPIRYERDTRALQYVSSGFNSIRSSLNSGQFAAQQAVGFFSTPFVGRRPDNNTNFTYSNVGGNINPDIFTGLESSIARLQSTQTTIDNLQREIAAGGGTIDNPTDPGTGTGPGPGPGGGGTVDTGGGIVDPTNPNNPSGVPTKPSPRLPEEGRRATADRPRMDRRRLNIAFGAPRVGVGINIPSY